MKSIPEATEDFFKAGGALDADAPSYVVRRADGELLQAVQSGQYCNVLTARQMGKSSLMVRIVRRLQDAGVRTVTIDLTGLGTRLSPSEWYFGLVSRFKRQLGLRVDEAACGVSGSSSVPCSASPTFCVRWCGRRWRRRSSSSLTRLTPR